MNLVIQGPQGSGKGTQASLLAQKYQLNYFETGKVLRSIAASDNKYAPALRSALNRGELVPDEFLRLIAWDFISKNDKTGFIFDGYPRSLAQYDHLKDMLMKFGQKLDLVINIHISEPESVRRLSSRRLCSKCGEIYNLVTQDKPKGENCDKCGGQLVQREDDQPEAVRRRLQIYYDQTHPVFEQATREGIAIQVNGERPINVIYEELVSIIDAKVRT